MMDVKGDLPNLAPRWFLVRNARAKEGMRLLQPRWAISYLRDPTTGAEIRRARGKHAGQAEAAE
ncbi:MAG: hypothetical protein QM778_18645 [Myxococcales bacterium]